MAVRHKTVLYAITSAETGTVGSEGAVRLMSQVPGQFAAILVDESVTLAVGVSVAAGVFYCVCPTCRASILNPIDALRFE